MPLKACWTELVCSETSIVSALAADAGSREKHCFCVCRCTREQGPAGLTLNVRVQ